MPRNRSNSITPRLWSSRRVMADTRRTETSKLRCFLGVSIGNGRLRVGGFRTNVAAEVHVMQHDADKPAFSLECVSLLLHFLVHERKHLIEARKLTPAYQD